jgi:hypothetical protein
MKSGSSSLSSGSTVPPAPSIARTTLSHAASPHG